MVKKRKRKRPFKYGPPILNANEIEKMRAAGRLAADILDEVEPMICAGITTLDINKKVDELTEAAGAISAPYGYRGFPKHCCTSINQVVCHGIPSEKHILKEGDIINVDVTPILHGFHGDTSRTFGVGQISHDAQKLIDTTYESLWRAIYEIKPDVTIGVVGKAIQPFVEAKGYSVVREFTGHGLGEEFHCPPTVFHHVTLGSGTKLQPGMAFTIEPMINQGVWKTRVLADDWTAITMDGKLSAQFEHTLVVTRDGYDVLTLGKNETPPAKPT